MDPLTQGIVGAALPQSTAGKYEIRIASITGFVSGLLADSDIFIRSSKDPLLFLEYHRHFTHSLVFIPLGGLICGLLLYSILARFRNINVWQICIFCTLGYATHALLDTCTSYGTMLLWPFSNERISWNIISVIDPIFTIPVCVLVVLAGIRRKSIYGRVALIWIGIYFSIGLMQRENAIEMGREIAASRGHNILRISAKPSFANIIVWRIIYETEEKFFVDAARVGIRPHWFIGSSISKLNIKKDFVWLDPDSQQAIDVERFRWFSEGFVAMEPEKPNRVGDVRFSAIPNQINSLWSIELSPLATKNKHVSYRTNRENMLKRFSSLWAMIIEKK